MYSNLNLYYLEQMGIRPWIEKSNYESPHSAIKSSALLVVTPKLNDKEHCLLNNILSFLDLKEEQVIHLETEEAVMRDKIQAAFTLLFGLPSQPTPTTTRVESLNYLLNNPLAKKQLFKTLISLREQLASL